MKTKQKEKNQILKNFEEKTILFTITYLSFCLMQKRKE